MGEGYKQSRIRTLDNDMTSRRGEHFWLCLGVGGNSAMDDFWLYRVPMLKLLNDDILKE